MYEQTYLMVPAGAQLTGRRSGRGSVYGEVGRTAQRRGPESWEGNGTFSFKGDFQAPGKGAPGAKT